MKYRVKWYVIAAALVVLIGGAGILYYVLADDYGGINLLGNVDSSDDAADGTYAAPDFTVVDYDGNEVHLSDYEGTPVVLNFWATWCYYCTLEMPDFDRAYEDYPQVQFLMVNATDGVQETMEAAKEYVEEEGFRFDVFFDTETEAVNAYSVTGLPSTFFIDEDGNLVTYSRGMIDTDTLEQGIRMILE